MVSSTCRPDGIVLGNCWNNVDSLLGFSRFRNLKRLKQVSPVLAWFSSDPSLTAQWRAAILPCARHAGRVVSFSRGGTIRFIASVLFLGFASLASAQTVGLTISTSQTASILPYIYGINGTINSGGFNNLTLTRAGGNRWTAYNWTNNYSNAGMDYYFENDNALCPNGSTAPAAAVAGTVQNAISNNAAAC